MLYDEPTFATLDADGDGTLDQEELAHLTRQSIPNLELTVDLLREGASAAGDGLHLDPAFRFDPAAASPESSGQPAKLITGGEEVEMTGSGFADGQFAGPRHLIWRTISSNSTTDNNDYLEESELRRFNAVGLMALDANGDGKLYFDEIKVYVDAQAEAAALRLRRRLWSITTTPCSTRSTRTMTGNSGAAS